MTMIMVVVMMMIMVMMTIIIINIMTSHVHCPYLASRRRGFSVRMRPDLSSVHAKRGRVVPVSEEEDDDDDDDEDDDDDRCRPTYVRHSGLGDGALPAPGHGDDAHILLRGDVPRL
jgi:hypothetical protein